MAGRREASKPVELDQTSVGRLSRIDARQNQQMSAGLFEREMARHEELLTALERIEKRTFGHCVRWFSDVVRDGAPGLVVTRSGSLHDDHAEPLGGSAARARARQAE